MYYFAVIYVLILAVCLKQTHAFGKSNIHLNLHIPEYINHHQHTKFIFLKDKDEVKKPVALNNHNYGNGHARKGQFKAVKTKEQGDHSSYDFIPSFNDGYSQSWKTSKSEEYQTETIDNPDSNNPFDRYIVKGTIKVREKHPFGDVTTGYDHEYQYPSIVEYDYYKNSHLVDYNNAKTDPFSLGDHDSYQNEPFNEPKKKVKTFYYQSPDYNKNFQLVNSYLENNRPETKKNKDEDFYGSYKSVDVFDYPGPSEELSTYEKYSKDGPSFDYFGDYSQVKPKKATTN